MTENELRQKVANIMNGWVGSARGSAGHLEILSIYNSYKPLARGYKVQVSDPHCATTTSAAFIKAGIAPYTGTECGCYYFVEDAKRRGIWVENDAYVPKVGDAVLYDWQDSGVGDNAGTPDHIGIVTQVNGTTSFVVTEGNMNGGNVGKRTMSVNGKYIRGFICPDYAAIAKKLGGSSAAPTEQATATPAATATAPAASTPATKTVKATEAAHYRDDSLAGAYECTASLLNIRNGAGTTKKTLTQIKKGTVVRCYGFYNVANGAKWLYIQFTQGNVTYTAFASAAYLKKK